MQAESDVTSVNENVPGLGEAIAGLDQGLVAAHGVVNSIQVQPGNFPAAQRLKSAVQQCAQSTVQKLSADATALRVMGGKVVTAYKGIKNQDGANAATVDTIDWQNPNA
nr:DUF2563 family protein [Kibdelosporangium sp. MJ126-NF4]CEL16310.1 hypothetical protein [Kibdelosporangium sp. MJ126-NF4]CTQ94234.1 hypothetical protein [Kibdelosporangium sp. MJ126-NF4]